MMILTLGPGLILSHRLCHLSPGASLLVLGPPFLKSSVMAICAWLAGALVTSQTHHWLLVLLAQVLTGTLVYCSSMLMDPVFRETIRSFARFSNSGVAQSGS